MLEGVVARLLNQLLGKYVVDLDTENLNVGIFSGQVQMNDVRLKPEALYELELPIEVVVGTIGKIWLQIPWNRLWSQPVVWNMENIHILAKPIVRFEKYDLEKDRRLIRAYKKRILAKLDKDRFNIGGPQFFAEHLVTKVLNNMQINITNVHIRYEDTFSLEYPIACGLCIGSISAESTNSKWKACKVSESSNCAFYLVKMEGIFSYWNNNFSKEEWNFPSDYYAWRNAMANTLQNFSFNSEDVDFILKPMTTKMKMTINKAETGHITKINSDLIIQDCSIQISKEQYNSIHDSHEALSRMLISWNYLHLRPTIPVFKNKKAWWKYACFALLEQRIRPYTWTRIKQVREHCKKYTEDYKIILMNPNDIELKLDLQKHEDNLSLITIIIARQLAKQEVELFSLTDKSLWILLPSPEKTILCDKLGFTNNVFNKKNFAIEHLYQFRIGNVCASFTNSKKVEIAMITLTQLILTFVPNLKDSTYNLSFKLEGIVVEGSNANEHLTPILYSEHVPESPAYFFKIDLEKKSTSNNSNYKLNCTLGTIEIIYDIFAMKEINNYLGQSVVSVESSLEKVLVDVPDKIFHKIRDKVKDFWDVNLNVKVPIFIIPENGDISGRTTNLLILDLGKLEVTTDLFKRTDVLEYATQMELEEQLYSRLNIDWFNIQILFGNSKDKWKESMKEKDTELHILSKTKIKASYALSIREVLSIPKYKFSLTFENLKINVREGKIIPILDFANLLFNQKSKNIDQSNPKWPTDLIVIENDYFRVISSVRRSTGLSKAKTKQQEMKNSVNQNNKRNSEKPKQDMNEAWARAIDLPGLEDNISPSNKIRKLFRLTFNDFSVAIYQSNSGIDKQYLTVKLQDITVDIAHMTFGPAYQLSVKSISLTDKCHTTSSGQYLDLIHTPYPSKDDVFTLLYRKVDAKCPEFWTHFHGVETSLVADFDVLHLTLHKESVETLFKYFRYIWSTVSSKLGDFFFPTLKNISDYVEKRILSVNKMKTPVPPGAVKYSQSGRLTTLDVKICASDFDIMNILIAGFEIDLLFRANERFVVKSFLRHVSVDHLSEMTLYPKIVSTDGDKVYEMKFIQNASHLIEPGINPSQDDKIITNGTFKFFVGRIHVTFLYKIIVQFQRFISGMEMVPQVDRIFQVFLKNVTKITDTLKPNSKTHLVINIEGPVILFPQKSDSPNVIILNTGELNLENFFKRYSNDVIDNILVKLNEICLSRAVMGLTTNIEMQETMIDPIGLNLDIKSYISQSNSFKDKLSWEIDGNMDTIQINLGQRDLATLIACYKDNIGEGKLLDLLPEKVKSSIKEDDESLEAVKKLESFFCKPKQKDTSLKISLDGVHLTLYFDPSELLSSPIRDLNHGFCKIELTDVNLYTVIYTDKTVEGKLNAEVIVIEELGLDVNSSKKYVLESTIEESLNNNAKVTINKPPVIDITFTQNKSYDKAIDTIIGSLCLSLSVPFCEKIAVFVLESLPKETLDLGIVNHGYIVDYLDHQEQPQKSTSSLTVALRINKPEFIFVIESTAKKQKQFVTKTEVLMDYSRHNNALNLVLSLSGIHTLFYDSGLNNSDPYVVLKRCEIEMARSFSEDKGEKVSLSLSPIQLHICNRIVHSIIDILHDISEHFKIPEQESKNRKKFAQKSFEQEDMWESKKIPENLDNVKSIRIHTDLPLQKIHQVFLMTKTEVLVVFHLEENPVLMFKSSMEMTVYGWSNLLNSTCQLTLQSNYFNEKLKEWEPFLDPVVVNECEYKPYEMVIKVFRDRAMPIMTCPDVKMQKDSNRNTRKKIVESISGDEDSEEEMIYMEPATSFKNNQKRRITTSLSSFLQESDSENEDGSNNDKLVTAISDLFTGDWNESDASSVEQTSSDDEENFDEESASYSKTRRGENNNDFYEKATYILVDAKETLNITITPSLLRVIKDINTSYFGKTLSIINNKNGVNLINEIGPNTKVELYQRINNKENCEEFVLIDTKTFESEDSYPNSPLKETSDLLSKESDDFSKMESDLCSNFEIAETFDFPPQTTSSFYESAQGHFLKIYVPGFLPTKTNCPKRAWEKLISLASVSNQELYYLIARKTVGKVNSVTISSPLEIRNETCFAMSIFYEPAVLQKLNLDTIGNMKNPFDSTMRMAVLEPHEQFHVPLFIAFHCKLFIQPAYAETYYVSDEGLFWKTLSTEFDIPHYIVCRPKDKSNLEVFSLKVELQKNISTRNGGYSQSIPNYVITLLPPLVLQNYLPYALEVQNIGLKQQLKIEPAEMSSIYSVDMNKDQKFLLKVSLYGSSWSGIVNVTKDLDEKVIVMNTEQKSNVKHLCVNVKANKGNNIVYVYVPYWLINKTGLPLEIKVASTNTVCKSSKEDIILLTFKPNMKRTICAKVYDSKWSNDFGMDAAGTSGLVVCKDVERGRKYSFILTISLSKTCPMLTKLVYFLPTFLVSNKTTKFLRFMEVNEKTDLWIDLHPNETLVFWPQTHSMQMQVKYKDGNFTSQSFPINSCLLTVLRMERGTALSVQVNGGKMEPFCITFQKYQNGDAPILLKNMCSDVHLKVQQSEQNITHIINPYHSLLYTWDEPGKSRQLLWNVYVNRQHGFFIDVEKNGFGEEKINHLQNNRMFRSQQSCSTNESSNDDDDDDESDSAESILKSPINKTKRSKFKIYWICYHNGTQRVLLFSLQNTAIQDIKDKYFVEICHTEFLLSLSGLGVSVFGEQNLKKELSYLSVTSSPAIWEVNVGHKWKTLTLELASWIEDKYRLGYKKCQLKDYIHIDFEKMFMMKPFLAELRRSHNAASYLQYRKANRNQQINFLLNFLQIDNKQSNSIILRPISNNGNLLKNVIPFLELSCIYCVSKDYSIVRDFRANLQNFSLNIDNDFNIKLGELFIDNINITENASKSYREDIQNISKPMKSYLKEKQSRKLLIENIKISEISIQINLLNKVDDVHKYEYIKSPLSTFLGFASPIQVLTFTPVQNINHRISYYDVSNLTTNFQKVLIDVWYNFKCQFLQQFYVHVLGIQVLVNPFAFEITSSKNSKYLEDVVPNTQLNVYRCLLGHLNMSSAGLEQIVSNVFSNQTVENIYRFGRHGSYQKNYTVPSAILESYRNFNIGVVLALEQLIIKNNRGVFYDGETFFKSTGKALLSLILRHPDEKSNSILVCAEALHRAALLNEPIHIQQRLTRYNNVYLGLKPFSGYESLGNHLIETIQNGRFMSDIYWAHAALSIQTKSILIVTLQRLIKINKCRMWGPWEVDWCLDLDDMIFVPKITENCMILSVKKDEYKFVNSTGALEIEGNREVLLWLKDKIEQAMLVSLEEKSWSTTEKD